MKPSHKKSRKSLNNKQRIATKMEANKPSKMDCMDAVGRDVGEQEMPESTTQAHTEKPDAAKTQAGLDPFPEVTLTFMPARMSFLLMRGGQAMPLTSGEMSGIFKLGSIVNGKAAPNEC